MKKKIICSVMVGMLLVGCGSSNSAYIPEETTGVSTEKLQETKEEVTEEVKEDSEKTEEAKKETQEETGENAGAEGQSAQADAETETGSFVGNKQEEEVKKADQGTGYRTILVSYDTSQITSGPLDDPGNFDNEAVYEPSVSWEGEGVEVVSTYDEGDTRYEELRVTDFDTSLSITFEAGGPNNNYDMHDISIMITDENGNITTYKGEELMARYPVGLWYVQIYKQ